VPTEGLSRRSQSQCIHRHKRSSNRGPSCSVSLNTDTNQLLSVLFDDFRLMRLHSVGCTLISEGVRSNGGMTLIRGKSKNPDIKTSPIDTFPITNVTWTDLVKNPGFRVKESTIFRPHELHERLSLLELLCKIHFLPVCQHAASPPQILSDFDGENSAVCCENRVKQTHKPYL
jgi:hypothetical protein